MDVGACEAQLPSPPISCHFSTDTHSHQAVESREGGEEAAGGGKVTPPFSPPLPMPAAIPGRRGVGPENIPATAPPTAGPCSADCGDDYGREIPASMLLARARQLLLCQSIMQTDARLWRRLLFCCRHSPTRTWHPWRRSSAHLGVVVGPT